MGRPIGSKSTASMQARQRRSAPALRTKSKSKSKSVSKLMAPVQSSASSGQPPCPFCANPLRQLLGGQQRCENVECRAFMRPANQIMPPRGNGNAV
jgi:hypothetical protein